MPSQPPEDDLSSLEKARTQLYQPDAAPEPERTPLTAPDQSSLPHRWEEHPLEAVAAHPAKRHIHVAGVFLATAFVFFIIALGTTGYFLFYGGNSVSVDKISIDMQGPTTIAGGDTAPFSLTITNRNPVAIENATVEVDFPSGTLSADGSLAPYPRYIENLGTIESGATVTRSIKAIIFGGQGQALVMPILFSYGTSGSNTTFEKKSSYPLAVSSTPLSISVETLSETVSGKPLTFTLMVRSNATVPLENVVVTNALPFGFTVTGSSMPLSGSAFNLGTMLPGSTKSVTLTGTLTGQDGEKRVFHFSVGTAQSTANQAPAISYMTQDASVSIVSPFITTTLALNGSSQPDVVVTPGSQQSVVVNYVNTLSTSVTNATISIALSGSAIDYNSIQTTSGFYNSSTHTIVFSKDTDPALAQLAPNASGIGSFTFATLSANTPVLSPSINFTISVSGTRVGQSNVPEEVSASMMKTVKVATVASLIATSLYHSGPFHNTGPIPPQAEKPTTYTVEWNVHNSGSTVAGSAVTATLPSYVSYTGQTSGAGSFSYDNASRTVTWTIGDMIQGASAQGDFQVSLTPSTSQKGSAPALTSVTTFTGYDRFAGVQVKTSVDPVTTETRQDAGYSSMNGSVQ